MTLAGIMDSMTFGSHGHHIIAIHITIGVIVRISITIGLIGIAMTIGAGITILGIITIITIITAIMEMDSMIHIIRHMETPSIKLM